MCQSKGGQINGLFQRGYIVHTMNSWSALWFLVARKPRKGGILIRWTTSAESFSCQSSHLFLTPSLRLTTLRTKVISTIFIQDLILLVMIQTSWLKVHRLVNQKLYFSNQLIIWFKHLDCVPYAKQTNTLSKEMQDYFHYFIINI